MKVLKYRPSTLDRVFDDFINSNFNTFFKDDHSIFKPAVNISETDEGYLLELKAAGFSKDDVNISVDNDLLTIEGKIKNDEETKTKKYSKREFLTKSFKRSFHLPDTVNAESIQATFEHGILSLSIPKKEEAKPQPKRVIEIA